MTIIEEHHHYVSDMTRVSAFRKALREVIKPFHVVLDFASGTGILGMLACEAGAARVYSVECTSLIGVARQIAKANGFEERMKFIKGFGSAIELPEKVDVIVADQIGFFGQSRGMVKQLHDLSRRFLKPDGVVVPNRIDFWVAPIELPEITQLTEFWHSQVAGFDFSAMHQVAVNSSYPAHLKSENIIAEPHWGASLDLPSSGESPLTIEKEFTVVRGGTLHGIAGWFSAQLSPSVSLTNSPLNPTIKRQLMVHPIEGATPVLEGDRVGVKMTLRPADLSVTWMVEVRSAGQPFAPRVFRQSSFKGMLICSEDLERSRPDYVPRLSKLCKATAYITELCDGVRTLCVIEDEVFKRFPELFGNRAEAVSFVGSVLSENSTFGHHPK